MKDDALVEMLLSPETLDTISRLQEGGYTHEDIAKVIGVSTGMLSERSKRHEELWDALRPDEEWEGETAVYGKIGFTTMPAIEKITRTYWLRKVESWTKRGLNLDAVSALLGFVTTAELEEAVEKSLELQIAIRRGRARGEEEAAKRLWTIVQDPEHRHHHTCVQFMLKYRAWKPPAAPPAKRGPKEAPAPTATAESATDALRFLSEGPGEKPLKLPNVSDPPENPE